MTRPAAGPPAHMILALGDGARASVVVDREMSPAQVDRFERYVALFLEGERERIWNEAMTAAMKVTP